MADALPSWNEGEVKSAIVDFVANVTDVGSEHFVPESRRIAVFDNDGTLWSEKPFYFQFLFAMESLAVLAKADPSILTSDVLKAAARGDLKGALADGEHGLLEVASASHSGMSVKEFQAQARNWLATARHPKTGRPYIDMVYQPMLELLSFLRDNGFRTYIVSGGGVDLLRSFAEDVYGIPPYQVVGSMGNASYEVVDGKPLIRKEPGIFFIDDKGGKPIAISRQIGVRPIFVGGNSDGDFQMLEWCTAGDGPSLGIIVHHTDAEREWAYDRESASGRLNRGLDEGPARGWLLVDMQRDWSRVFP
jgi:phosphoglycolate phosphatase-like HAD superfamily hydrolase